jgi:hypothetical protein
MSKTFQIQPGGKNSSQKFFETVRTDRFVVGRGKKNGEAYYTFRLWQFLSPTSNHCDRVDFSHAQPKNDVYVFDIFHTHLLRTSAHFLLSLEERLYS